jgi:hypothetical protein
MHFGRRYGLCEERQSEVLALLGGEFHEPCRRELDGGGGNGEEKCAAVQLDFSAASSCQKCDNVLRLLLHLQST